MPRGVGTGAARASGGGRGHGRGKRHGCGQGGRQGRGTCRMRRAGRNARAVKRSHLPRATASTDPRTVDLPSDQRLPSELRDAVRRREVPRRVGPAAPVASIDEAACTLCGACQAACPAEAITLGEMAFKVNAEACCGCGACVEVCPNEAIKLNRSGRLQLESS